MRHSCHGSQGQREKRKEIKKVKDNKMKIIQAMKEKAAQDEEARASNPNLSAPVVRKLKKDEDSDDEDNLFK